MEKYFIKETEKILKSLEYIDVFVKEKEHLKELIKNGDKGAIQAVATDFEKTSATNNIGRTVENEVIHRDEMLLKIDMEIYRQLEYDRIVKAALNKMTLNQQLLYRYIYVDKLSKKEIAKKLNCSESSFFNRKKRLIKKLAIAIFGKDVLNQMSIKEKAETLAKIAIEYMEEDENLDVKGALYLAEMSLKKQGIEV